MIPTGLIALGFRRSLPLAMAAAFSILLVLAARSSAGDALFEAGAVGPASRDALTRENVWSVLFLLGVPALVWQSARLGTQGGADWLVTTGARPARLSFALFLGV